MRSLMLIAICLGMAAQSWAGFSNLTFRYDNGHSDPYKSYIEVVFPNTDPGDEEGNEFDALVTVFRPKNVGWHDVDTHVSQSSVPFTQVEDDDATSATYKRRVFKSKEPVESTGSDPVTTYDILLIFRDVAGKRDRITIVITPTASTCLVLKKRFAGAKDEELNTICDPDAELLELYQ